MIKHIFCDLDGTLYHNGISNIDIKAIESIEESGVQFHIATGRIFNHAYNMVKDSIKINGYYICENGSFIHDKDCNMIFKGTIDDNIVRKVIDRFESNNASMYFKYDGKIVLLGGEEIFKIYSDDFIVDPSFAEKKEFSSLVGNIGVVSDDLEELNRIELYYKSEFDEILDIYMSGPNTLNLVPKNVSKRTGIEYVCNILDVSEDEIATIGDSPNDINMLKDMKYGFAIEGARKEVIESANYSVKSVSELIEEIKKINDVEI